MSIKTSIGIFERYYGHPRQIRQILNSTAIGGEKIAKENQYSLLHDINLLTEERPIDSIDSREQKGETKTDVLDRLLRQAFAIK